MAACPSRPNNPKINNYYYNCRCSQDSPLAGVAAEQLELMPTDSTMMFREQLARLAKRGRPLRVGTFFSGCEIFHLAVRAVLLVAAKLFGIHLTSSLQWVVEKDSWKRAFIMARDKPCQAFTNLIELAESGFVAMDDISETEQHMASVDLASGGFECDTVCKLSKVVGPERENCLELGQGSTGTTGRATLRCIVYLRPPATVLENSSLLGPKNVAYIASYLNFHGIVIFPFMVLAETHRSAAKRERQFVAIAPIKDGPFDQFADGFEFPPFIVAFGKCIVAMQTGPGDPQSILWSKDDAAYIAWHQQAVADRATSDMKDMLLVFNSVC